MPKRMDIRHPPDRLWADRGFAGSGSSTTRGSRPARPSRRRRSPLHQGSRVNLPTLSLFLVGLLAVGCAADVRLRHPVTGQSATCRGGYYQHGLIGMANQTAKDLPMRCLDDYQRQGYERTPE